MFRTGLSLLLIAAALSGPVHAGINPGGFIGTDGSDAGVPAFSFLKLPISARSIGLAASSMTTDEEASVVQGNPAALALIEDYYYSLSHAEILGEFRHENLAFTLPTQSWGTFGGSANVLAATAFSDARDIDENPATPTAYDMALGLAYGHSIIDGRFAAGGRLDLIRSSLDGAVAYGYGVNAGLMFMLVGDVRLAAVVKNLSHGVRYNTSTAPLEPLPLSIGLELGKPLLDSRWSVDAGFLQGNEGILHYYGGAELRLIKYLVLRLGYDGSSQDRESGGWTGIAGGIGIKYDRITLDYGFKTLGPLGAYNAFTLNYSRKSTFRPRDEVLLEAAQEKYRKGKYGAALKLARAAVEANPYNFKAQALAQKLQLEIDRMDETAIALIYTANTDGRLGSEWRDGKPIGGLARRKTKLLELRGAQGKSLLLDAGNLNNPSGTLGQEKYVYGAYAQMSYDAVNLGSAELLMGQDRWDARLPLVCSQMPLAESRRSLLTEKILPLKRGEVMVLGAMEPANARGEALGGKELEDVAAAVRRRAGEPKQQRILVLLLNGSIREAYILAQKVPELDAIILSGESQALGSPMKSGKTLICSPGRGGTHIGDLTLLLDKHGRIRSFRHFLIPLDASIPEDQVLAKFLAPAIIDPNKISFDGYDDDYRAQVFAYVRAQSADAPGSVVLKDMRTGLSYPIPTAGLACTRPILGYGKNKLAFLGEDSSGAREIYVFEPGAPGLERLDTLTRMGGQALDIRWILSNNALLAAYKNGGKSDLYRIDPWSRGIRDLTKGRLGQVRGFAINKAGDRLVINSTDGSSSTMWVTNPELESPTAVATDRLFIGSPQWNPQGDKVAFLVGSPGVETDTSSDHEVTGELRVFDFTAKKLLTATEQSRVRDFAWSADGKRVFYSAGINLVDINAFNPDSLTLGKVTAPSRTPRSEEDPTPKVLDAKDGMLFESVEDGRRRILWTDLATRKEKVLVDSAAYNSLK
jgi:hypothetical protein